jgi:hypothetical protein
MQAMRDPSRIVPPAAKTAGDAVRLLTQTFRSAGVDTPELDARILVAHALNWGASWRSVASINNGNQVQLLTSPAADAQGRLTYRLATANNQLLTDLFQRTAGTSDVYQFQLTLRYSFN